MPVAAVDRSPQFLTRLLPRKRDAVFEESKLLEPVLLGVGSQRGRRGFGPRVVDAADMAVIELVDRNPGAKGLDSGPKPEVAEEEAAES